MTEEILTRLKAIDPLILNEVVRKDQRSPTFAITEWSVGRLSDKGIMNPDGLWLYRGLGQDQAGRRPWSVVLKILKRQEQEPSPTNMWHWKREVWLAQSGLTERLPGPVRAPLFYKVDETAEGAMLWFEYIENHPQTPWRKDDFVFAAHQIGRWNGAVAASGQLIDEPWLTRAQHQLWYPDADPERDFQNQQNQNFIQGELRKRYEQLWAGRNLFYETLESLPTIFTHFDTQRRNLIIRLGQDSQKELVLLDWAQCGLAPIGTEMYHMVGMSSMFFEWPLSAVRELDTAVFGSYLQGLRVAGCDVDAIQVRLAYTIWITIIFGIPFPNIMALWCSPDFKSFTLQQFGYAEADLFQQWLPMLTYALGCADEVWSILGKR